MQGMSPLTFCLTFKTQMNLNMVQLILFLKKKKILLVLGYFSPIFVPR